MQSYYEFKFMGQPIWKMIRVSLSMIQNDIHEFYNPMDLERYGIVNFRYWTLPNQSPHDSNLNIENFDITTINF